MRVLERGIRILCLMAGKEFKEGKTTRAVVEFFRPAHRLELPMRAMMVRLLAFYLTSPRASLTDSDDDVQDGSLGLGLLLALWNIGIHKSRALPRMRSAPVSEILESSQTTSITAAAVKALRRVTGEKSQLTGLKVQFVKDENSSWGLHS